MTTDDTPRLPDTDMFAEPGRWHTRCRACRHPLRDDESRRTGYGPDCLAKRTPPRDPIVRRPAAFTIDQDGIPGLSVSRTTFKSPGEMGDQT